jgi:hypothetical protein
MLKGTLPARQSFLSAVPQRSFAYSLKYDRVQPSSALALASASSKLSGILAATAGVVRLAAAFAAQAGHDGAGVLPFHSSPS